MDDYYYKYSDKIEYMDYMMKYMYEYNQEVYDYTQECYQEYGAPDDSSYQEYAKDYGKYKQHYDQYMQEYQKYKEQKDYRAMHEAYYKINNLNRSYYEKSMKVYYMYKGMYDANNYPKDSLIYRYMQYMRLYEQYQKTYYTYYYSRYYKNNKGHYYNVSLLKTDDVKVYPHKELQYDEGEMNRVQELYNKYGLTVPLMVTTKIGDDGKPYYHLVDGYYQYKAAMNAGEDYVPAIVYYGLPENVEHGYMSEPYYGYNYK